ncbi:MAG: DUF4931 domain-containing protein [Lactovum sp.]
MLKHTRNPLTFNATINKEKYSQTAGEEQVCPFCSPNQLVDIFKTEKDKIWLKNKFVTIENSLMTVLIESKEHEGDITSYSKKENQELFQFAMACWQETLENSDFQSVVMFKNFGPMSGGSLRHPHFQIVGLKEVDAYEELQAQDFKGLDMLSEEHLSVNLSTYPMMGTVEINVILSNLSALNTFADAVQISAKYLLNDFMSGRCQSYNLFFYQYEGKLICKVVPRFLTSPYFIGYKISQVYKMDRLIEIAEELSQLLK